MSQNLAITLDGREYVVRSAELTAIDAKDFRAAVGMSIMSVLTDPSGLDLDVVAGLVWLLRRRTERGLSFDAVAASINYDSDLAFAQTDGAANGAEAGNPET